MHISELGRKSISDVLCSFPAAAMPFISFLTQCHSSSPISEWPLQCHARKTNYGTTVANRTRYQKNTQTSSIFLVSQTFSRNKDATFRRHMPQEVWWCTARNNPFSHLWPGIIARRASEAASFISTWLRNLQSPPLPSPHAGGISSSALLAS